MATSVLIVGAGCFGLSTAIHLLQRGYSVTVLDRSEHLPAPDAASTDLNKIVRSSYSDPVYSALAKEAIEAWKNVQWGNSYHESGVIVLSRKSISGSYADKAYANDINLGSAVHMLPDAASMTPHFPPHVSLGANVEYGYLNKSGGWAHASEGVRLALEQVKNLGGKVIPGSKVSDILFGPEGRTEGVKLVTGENHKADVTVIAAGSWTSSLLSGPEFALGNRVLATGQSLATIQLTPEEALRYRDCPVVLDFHSGFYVFPPNDDGVMKLAIHAAGYTNPLPPPNPNGSAADPVSTPRTIVSHPNDGTKIPKIVAEKLRAGFVGVYPDLAERPFNGTRMCWYADTPDANWLIDFHPSHPGLLFATGGSGHAYKFLPVIGRLVADRLEGKLDASLVARFSFDERPGVEDPSRAGQKPTLLREEDLVSN